MILERELRYSYRKRRSLVPAFHEHDSDTVLRLRPSTTTSSTSKTTTDKLQRFLRRRDDSAGQASAVPEPSGSNGASDSDVLTSTSPNLNCQPLPDNAPAPPKHKHIWNIMASSSNSGEVRAFCFASRGRGVTEPAPHRNSDLKDGRRS